MDDYSDNEYTDNRPNTYIRSVKNFYTCGRNKITQNICSDFDIESDYLVEGQIIEFSASL